jgi:imidazolonepropionase-like amidohydrolase
MNRAPTKGKELRLMFGRFSGGRIFVVLVAVLGLCSLCAAQEEPVSRQERWRFYAPSTQVSNDPRRVPVPPTPQGPDGTLVLRGGRIFDGTGAAAREGTLVIVRNKIAKILAPGATEWPADARVIDVGGKTVMPGLIDLHTHITYAEPADTEALGKSMSDATLRGVEHLRYYIESGITSIRDVASAGEVPFRLKDWVEANRIAGPRVFAAGQLITSTDGHGDEGGLDDDPTNGSIRTALGADGWREAVRVQFKRGADVIKIASHFSKAEVAAAVAEAHALGLKVTCDCETFYIRWAVEAGVDMIEHPLPRTEETIRLMAEKGTQSDPTLVPYIIIFNQAGGYYETTSRRFTFSKDANFELVKKMKLAGITLGIGTDLVSDWYQFLPGPYVMEMKQFVKLGYTVPEVLVIATKTNAQMLDMGDKLGTLEAGKLADVTVIDGKPDVELDDLTKVSLVIRDGYIEVQDGRLFVPRHVPVKMPEEGAKAGATK